MIPKKALPLLSRQQYRVVGNHSGVKLCTWTKKSLRDEGFCYKQKFYGIKSHRCLQMTPTLMWCPNRCLYCWRAADIIYTTAKGVEWDEPEEILEGCIKAQRELLTGFKGFEGTNIKKWKEAQEPNQIAISLAGEPTLYPKLSALIKLCKRKGMTTFLVTCGQLPKAIENIEEPFRFYLSLDAPNAEIYKKIDVPIFKDYWKRLLKTLQLMKTMKAKKVIRLTLVKGYNMCNAEEYAKLIEVTDADYVECKAYMYVGYSRFKLKKEAMPLHNEVKEFSKKLASTLSYKIRDESEPSRVVLLTK